MTQRLTTDSVERLIHASPEALYDIVSDVTRTPEMSPEVVRCTWVGGATGPAVGARFRAVNHLNHFTWPNWPVVLTADPGREFTFARTEPLVGTLEWRYQFAPKGIGATRVVESYTVTREPTRFFYWLLEHVGGVKDRASDMRAGMATTLERLARMAERVEPRQHW